MQQSAFDVELVRRTMKERKVTQTGLAKIMGLPSQSALSNIFKGIRRVTADEAADAYQFLGLKTEPTIQSVPLIGITSAGNWREAVPMARGSIPIPPGVASDRSFALQISGDSMNLIIEDGGYVVIDPARKELHAGKCYLIQNGEVEATVKCYRQEPSRFEPVSSNPAHKAFMAADADFTVLGRVVWKGAPL